MRCNPLRWLWGVPLLAMWFLMTFVSEREPVESDLASRATMQLEQTGHGWADVGFIGRDGVLRGRASSTHDRDAAMQIVRNVWGVRIVNDDTSLLRAVARYVWSAQYQDDNIVLAGFVPNAIARTRIMKVVKTRFPNADVEDRLKLARGQIEIKPWLAGISFGLDQLSSLESGKLDFVNMDYTLAGRAPSYSVYKGVRSALSNATPKGVQLANQDVAPPTVAPYTWNAKKTATQVVISGYVPSEKARSQLFEHAKKQFPGFAIIDRMETAAGAVPGWSRATSVLLDQLARLEEGNARMSDGKLQLNGHAPSKDIADQTRTRAKEDVPDEYSVATDLTFPKPRPPMINPFVTSIDANKSRVRLFGYVPGEEERAKLLQAAQTRFPSHTIVDELKLGSGEPQSWHACLLAGLSGIEKLGSGQVRLSGQKVTVTGETMDEAIAERLPGDVRAAANRACMSTVNIKLNAPPEPQLNWSAANSGAGQIVLDGEVPSRDTRTSLLAAAAKLFPDADIIDKMTVVPGYAKKWRGTAHTGLALLAKLRKGRASISGRDLVVTGEAKDTAIASAVKGQLKNSIVRGYTGRGNLTVRSDSMIWAEAEAKRKAEAARDAARLTAQRRAEEEARVEASQAQARRDAAEETRRKDEEKARALVAAQARRDAQARKKAEADAARTKTEAEAARAKAAEEKNRRDADQEARRKAEADARAQAKARAAEQEAARKAEAFACRDAMRSLATQGVIRFKFASADLDRKSHPTLVGIARQAIGCPAVKIKISGHTDSVGAAHRNLSLSKRRAQSVVDYLVGEGVARSRLDAVGYGETKPYVDNDSKANRAKNRRIEFDVK